MKPATLKFIARGLLSLVAFFMLFNGLGIMFNPVWALSGMFVSAESAEALSHVRALWGGAITAIGLSVAIAAVTLKIDNARPAVLFTFMLVLARVVGLVMDGMFENAIVFIAVSIAVFLVLLIAHKLLDLALDGEAQSAV